MTDAQNANNNPTTPNDPLTDFSVPQDADIVSDDVATDDPGEKADRVAENPAVDADTPAEAEELTAEPGA